MRACAVLVAAVAAKSVCGGGSSMRAFVVLWASIAACVRVCARGEGGGC